MTLTRNDETWFFTRARSFLEELCGDVAVGLDPDDDLIELGVLDSLLLVSFLMFVAAERGAEIEDVPDLRGGLSLRGAYRTLYAVAASQSTVSGREGGDGSPSPAS